MKKKIILIIALMISTTSINAASNSIVSNINTDHDNWKHADSPSGPTFFMDLYTLRSLGKSLVKDPRYFNAFMHIIEIHILYNLTGGSDDEYPTPNQITNISNNVLGILNNLDSFTVENQVDVYNVKSDVRTKSNTKNYKNNTALINAFLEGNVISRKNLGAAPFNVKMFTH